MTKDGEIVGLTRKGNGRSCETHDCWRDFVSEDDLVHLKFTVVDVDGNVEEVIEVVLVCDGTELFTIGFLPYNIVKSKNISSLIISLSQLSSISMWTM